MAHYCSILPPHLLKHIIDSPLTSPPTLIAAQKTYDHVCRVQDNRVAKDYAQYHVRHGFAAEAKATTHQVYRKIYTSAKTNDLEKILLFEEGAPLPVVNKDHDARNVYDFFGKTYQFYNEVYKAEHTSHSLFIFDDAPGPPGFDNAFFDGKEMAFGDGDGDVFGTFTKNVDVIGHELTHGVTQWTADLVYEYQSGALNESMSDVFGSMIKQYFPKTLAEDADWLIGEGIFLPSVKNARALRSMRAPGTAYNNPKIGKDPQPATMDDYQDLPLSRDRGGVHINSGIPNYAFYLASTSLGGYSWDKAGRVWYAALTDRSLKSVDSGAAFKAFANLTIKHAGILFDEDTQATVRQAWIDVKVLDGRDEL
ncbi:hypothetical protein EYC84_001427 [Monilinia fructicola]|uniref:Peptidase M4 C-terminal domain-containing protein n=1 Tax=Monilinia fructicola TaxID=38448 RepID=A0A5M9JPK9_MONFR|nr:hypothetical protein EYC84_001427 [Monilinia fructicola]